jgi:amino acid transporter
MSMLSLILGRPLATREQQDQKIGVLAGVPAMGLDGLGSSAYGPEAALTILLPLGAAGLHYIGPITAVIMALLVILYVSYRQTIAAYPVNGGSYTVARENLGVHAGLLAAAALMIDYVLNVAVGISAGVAALVSAFPVLHHYTLPLCLLILTVVTLVNLRGTHEAGLAFAIPTYLFLATMLAVLALGVIRAIGSGGHPRAMAPPPAIAPAAQAASIWLILRAFASGCTAMTGVEAVSNGVSAFREPIVKNAHRTLSVIVLALAILLGAIAYLSHAYRIGAMDQSQAGYQSILSQLVGAVAGRGWFYFVTLCSILAVLCLSANTSFVDFPRLCRLIARDDFLPRGFTVVGRRLVYSIGILFLAGASALLLIVFDGITDRLIPLFAVGAFLAFTLSQAGMVMHWRREMREKRGAGVRVRLWVNGIGAVATGAALAIILTAKFREGAWITILALPVLVGLFKLVHRHYEKIQQKIEVAGPLDLSHNEPPVVLLPIRCWDKLSAKATRFGMRLSHDVVAIHLTELEGEAAEQEAGELREKWAREAREPARRIGVPEPKLVVLKSPYRKFIAPLLKQIDALKGEYPGRLIAVVIPETVERHWWQYLLHRQRALRLRRALWKRGDYRVILISVPWYMEE